ncbi:ParB N-terminal domain-containing protein [Botrimarina mediterranea]|uniref:ParB N-terminal domain-containing protein n=1 Tax=Botrimarina mediterranea TaxID=2528022 RepID=UPI00118AE6FE|nr:ParB-like nuclease domain protein [Planctomycetes bacterium K2D]
MIAKPKLHPAAEIPPPLSDEDYEALKASIAEHGLIDAITLFDGKVLDGRHRLRICDELGIEARFEETDLAQFGGSAEFFVEARLSGRNMSQSQKAMVAARMEPFYAERAKERQKLSQGRGVKGPETIPDLNGDARDEAGAAHGVTGRTVSKAKNVIASGCKQLIDAVDSNRLDITTAENVCKELTGQELEEVVAVAFATSDPKAALRTAVAEPPKKPAKRRKKPSGDGERTLNKQERDGLRIAIKVLIRSLEAVGLYQRFEASLDEMLEAVNNG